MAFSILLAKSGEASGRKTASQTILQHTRAVMEAAERLVEKTGEAQLRALGLEPASWFGRLWREIRVAALLHDLGKANDHFQGMIHKTRLFPQAIRHEAVSYWIATRPDIRKWVGHAIGDVSSVDLVLWAIAGHHRKFPPSDPNDMAGADLHVLFGHNNFRETLAWGGERLGLVTPPELPDDTLRFAPSRRSVLREFEDAQCEANELTGRLNGEEKRYLALLKACLIGADVAGSIGRKGKLTMVQWISEAFANVPTVEQLDGIVMKKLKGRTLQECAVEGEPRAIFQIGVGAKEERVVYIRAGCGTGKTLAAYHWAARRCPGRRLFFCYPTMGTATEGYRDYLKDMDVDAALVHGRAEIDMEMLSLGDDEPDMTERRRPEDQSGRAAADSSGALDQWSTPLVSCTVDTVLGLTQNQRRGLYAWPSIAGAAVVFDEIHSYDEALFAALLRFLVDVRGIPCLLMTASLPATRLTKIKAALSEIGETLGEVQGPKHLEEIKRYSRDRSASRWDRVREVFKADGKVLWVVNTVDEAMALAETREAKAAEAILYHSRFRYIDRVKRHQAVIDAFDEKKNPGPAFAITTQVAEMSLDLSANLLVTQLAPIPSLIQRLGRLNRRAVKDDPWPFLVYEPERALPYEQEQLDQAKEWLKELGDGDLSQSDLISKWKSQPTKVSGRSGQFIWLDGGFVTEPRPLREATPGIEIILRRDVDDVKAKRLRPEEVRIPMPIPKDPAWRAWPEEIAFCKVPPDDRIDYDGSKGAQWKR
jgi:CRISPR-associated endonuclease/helicase Cas3